MKILLVNDDGYKSKGIELLKDKLSKYGEVYIFAPTHHQSGKSMSFTLGKGFKIEKYNDHEYSMDGTPVDCVTIALQYLKEDFDLVVSGCNNGLNISYDTLYSGTIGVCIEALNRGYCSVAFSTDINHFEIVEKEFDRVFRYILENNLLSPKYVLNVNFPVAQFDSIKGINVTKLVFKKDEYYIWEENGMIYTERNEDLTHKDVDSDVYNVCHGIVSITPMNNSLFDYYHYKKIKQLD